eukprot:TRINITY_DN11136_c0_g1_i1.p1 TRINITY_DN11136_c0_g1~~TRINITY_DN11136_c0_g1_i1.p1  ORF type:complete len:289 (-),score=24.14 TRINITY_DN11136_c0_g1_i1:131-997(-)
MGYQYFSDIFDIHDRERLVFVFLGWLVPTFTFWSLNCFMYVVIHYDLFRQYRIVSRKDEQWPASELGLIRKALTETSLGHLIVRPIAVSALFDVFKYYGMPSVFSSLPSFFEIAYQLLVCLVVTDALFYWSHRILHHRFLYKYFHKQHHEFKLVSAAGCEYASPLEQVCSNYFPSIAAPMFLGYHPIILWLWVFFREVCTIDVHCGYQFPFSPWRFVPGNRDAPKRHDFHHAHNAGNYGEFLYFWDWLCATDIKYRDHQLKVQSIHNHLDTAKGSLSNQVTQTDLKND